MIIYIIALFFIMVPKQLITLPSVTSSPTTINLTHAVIFSLIYWLTHKMVWNISNAYLNPNKLEDDSQDYSQVDTQNSVY